MRWIDILCDNLDPMKWIAYDHKQKRMIEGILYDVCDRHWVSFDCFSAYFTLHFLYNLDAMRWNIAWGDCRNMPGLVQSGGCIAKRYLWARDWQAPDRRVRWEVHHRMHHMIPRIHLHEHGIRCLTFCHNLIDRTIDIDWPPIWSSVWPHRIDNNIITTDE